MVMKESFEDYCWAGFGVLLIISLGLLAVYVIPIEDFILAAIIVVALIIITAICYILGRLAYYIIDKLQ
jgi:hypothetical protein